MDVLKVFCPPGEKYESRFRNHTAQKAAAVTEKKFRGGFHNTRQLFRASGELHFKFVTNYFTLYFLPWFEQQNIQLIYSVCSNLFKSLSII
jgi:hypothetical protein